MVDGEKGGAEETREHIPLEAKNPFFHSAKKLLENPICF